VERKEPDGEIRGSLRGPSERTARDRSFQVGATHEQGPVRPRQVRERHLRLGDAGVHGLAHCVRRRARDGLPQVRRHVSRFVARPRSDPSREWCQVPGSVNDRASGPSSHGRCFRYPKRFGCPADRVGDEDKRQHGWKQAGCASDATCGHGTSPAVRVVWPFRGVRWRSRGVGDRMPGPSRRTGAGHQCKVSGCSSSWSPSPPPGTRRSRPGRIGSR